ncbi:MAG TPA: hypothetical protein VJ397_04295, partial [Thermoplasmata archaeon]|nr:hypothetical protein [Thermoplasmata archaeon]
DPTSSVAYLVGTSTAVANTLALYAGVALLQGYVARITEGPVDVWFRSSVLRLAAVEVLPVLLLVWQFLLLPSV